VYSAVVEGLEYIEAKSEDKFPQLKALYTITEDGELQGRNIGQWLSFSPKSLFRMKAFFDAFGAEVSELVVDEDTLNVTSPDISGAVVQIKVLVQPHYLDKSRKVNKIEKAPVVSSTPAKPKAAGVRPGSRTVR
jgi:hypothetical protein